MTDFHKKSIQSLLSEKRLAEAFAKLRQTAQTLQNWQLNNRLDELEESYKYMIRYVADGCNDPQREEIHNGITAKLMELADITEQELTVQNSPKLYYETLRMERKYPRSLEALLEAYRECADKTALFYELPADKQRGGCEWRQFSRGAIGNSRSPSATGTAPEVKSGCRAEPSMCPGRCQNAAYCNTSTPKRSGWKSGSAVGWMRTTAPPLNSTPKAG